MGKECDLRRDLGISEDTRFICNPGGSIIGIIVRDGSFDYSPEGQRFLKPKEKVESSARSAGLTPFGIYIE